MITDNLDVGCKFGTEHYKVTVKLQYPENDADVAKLLKTEKLRAKMVCRGWAIFNQENSGARALISKSTVTERADKVAMTAKVQALIDSLDPANPPKQTTEQAPVVLSETALKAAMKKGDVAALQVMLLAAGLKNVSVK